jgi:superfamily II RNA helicase
MTLHPVTEEDPKKYEKWVKKKSELLEDIENMERQSEEMLSQLKNTPQHITWGEFEENERFNRLLPGRKRLTDTVKMIAYRAETVMTGLLKSASFDLSKSRNLLQSLFVTDADIHPDTESKKLFVKIHGASTQVANSRLIKLFELLNKTETKYPGTDLQLVYELVTQDR